MAALEKIQSDYSTWLTTRTENAGLFSKRKMLLVFGALVVITLFISLFRPENDLGFASNFPFIIAFFIIHLLLPTRYKPFLFPLIGIALLWISLGALATGIFCVLFSFVFIVLDSRINSYLRFLLLLLFFSFLYLCRIDWIRFELPGLLFPFIGTLFMFRTISFLYERSVTVDSTPWIMRINYFLLFPNLFFLMIPIIDYKKFGSSWYSRPAEEIYWQGIRFLLIGLLFAVLYRLVYLFGVPENLLVTDAQHVLWFLLSGFFLSVRIVGLFYLGIGTLSLFGFSFPPVFGNYFAADSFTKLWQRINVYWREFMVRVFYYPTYFKLRDRVGNEKGKIVISLLFVFLISAFLHSWQQFCITGQFVFRPTDFIFWMIFGILIAVETIRKMGKSSSALFFRRFLYTLLVFVSMCGLWALWTGSGIKEWLYIVSRITVRPSEAVFPLLLFILLFAVFIFISDHVEKKNLMEKKAMMMALLMLFSGLSFGKLMDSESKGQHRSVLQQLFDPSMMNKRDRKRMERGYYSKVLDTEDLLRRISAGRSGRDWNPHNYLVRYTGNILYRELLPDSIQSFKGTDVITNSFGLRDNNYLIEKSSNSYRIALLGGSYEMGSGVDQEKDFESLTEDFLNRDFPNRKNEVWNYGLGGYGLLQAVFLTDKKVMVSNPDMIVYVAHSGELERVAGDLTFLIKKRLDLVYPELEKLVQNAGVQPTMCELEIEQRLFAASGNILSWGLSKMSQFSLGKPCVLVYLPTLGDPPSVPEKEQLFNIAMEYNWKTVDLSDVYDNEFVKELYLSSWDNHPNEKGHFVIANSLYSKLRNHIR